MTKLEIEKNITRMMDNFKTASTSLLELSAQRFEENLAENAIYGIAYAKPLKRLSKLLSVDREILLLFTTFTSQQARTVAAISKTIADSNGRLEPTVAIVIHPDPRGNLNLRTWGRENGISVLPMYYVEEQYPMQAEQFESILCRELFAIDPFDVTGPVSNDNQFYGRRTEAQTIARQLQLGQIKALLGIRKIGKTSILNRIIDICNMHHNCLVIVIDCSKDEISSLSAEGLLSSIAYTLKMLIDSRKKYSMLLSCSSSLNISKCANALLDQIYLCEIPLIIAFDEVDYITPGSPTASHWGSEFNNFWRNFRAVYQESLRENKPVSVVVSGVSSKWFKVESINGVENAALAMIPEDYLSPLPRGASNAMIKVLSRVSGLQFTDTSADFISGTCCDSPYWIRKACSYIHKNIDIECRPLKLQHDTVTDLLEKFVSSEGVVIAQVALEHLFRVYPELKNYMKMFYLGEINKIPKRYLNVLEKYGLIQGSPSGKWALSGAMICEGLKVIFDEDDNAPEIGHILPDVNTSNNENKYEEWADELALIGRRRNLLERKMRNIVLNFIRQDSLQKKLNTKDRILSRIEAKKREQISSLGSDEVMDKLLWTELCIIISKEWSLFERIFNDKNLFALNTGIINERYDAHAKPADAADLALYRRSLSWLEGCINAI